MTGAVMIRALCSLGEFVPKFKSAELTRIRLDRCLHRKGNR